jgi:hypothetical protein
MVSSELRIEDAFVTAKGGRRGEIVEGGVFDGVRAERGNMCAIHDEDGEILLRGGRNVTPLEVDFPLQRNRKQHPHSSPSSMRPMVMMGGGSRFRSTSGSRSRDRRAGTTPRARASPRT